MSNRVGRLEHVIRRMFIANGGQPIRTTEIVRRCYQPRPRTFPGRTKFAIWQYRAARRAAKRFAIPVGRSERGQGKPMTFAPKASLLALITGK